MKKEYKFEEAINELENIVRHLEGGELSLDEAISSYEKAMELVKLCNSKIELAENKIRLLTKAEDGTVFDVPFTPDEA